MKNIRTAYDTTASTTASRDTPVKTARTGTAWNARNGIDVRQFGRSSERSARLLARCGACLAGVSVLAINVSGCVANQDIAAQDIAADEMLMHPQNGEDARHDRGQVAHMQSDSGPTCRFLTAKESGYSGGVDELDLRQVNDERPSGSLRA